MAPPKLSVCDVAEPMNLVSENAKSPGNLEGWLGTEPDHWDLEDWRMMGTGALDNWDLNFSERRRVMRVHILGGSFFPASANCEGGCPRMDGKVWGKLPDDIIWRVLLLVPLAKQYQFQVVSRRWRQVLTSADFRTTTSAAPPGEAEQQPQPRRRVIACATPCCYPYSSSKLRHLDIKLGSFVPSWFWRPERSYAVVTAGNGLVCIANDTMYKHSKVRAWAALYCVLNPLARTCAVLPKPPFPPLKWVPPSATTLTIFGNVWGDVAGWEVATFDLAAKGGSAGAGWQRLVVCRLPVPLHELWLPPDLYAGEIHLYNYDKVHVLAPVPGSHGLLEVAASLDIPSVTQLGLYAPSHWFDKKNGYLVARGHTLFFVARIGTSVYLRAEVACGVWRLARDRKAWEEVARLDVQEVERLTNWDCDEYEGPDFDWGSPRGLECRRNSGVFGACVVQELVCCHYVLPPSSKVQGFAYCLLGFNLDTGNWSLVHKDNALALHQDKLDVCVPTAFDAIELRPDLFLP